MGLLFLQLIYKIGTDQSNLYLSLNLAKENHFPWHKSDRNMARGWACSKGVSADFYTQWNVVEVGNSEKKKK